MLASQRPIQLRAFSIVLLHVQWQGLPRQADVEALLAWPCWQLDGQFNRGLFRSFASIFSRKGLPSEEYVVACLSWLSGTDDLDRDALDKIGALFSSVFAKHRSAGIPDIERLGVYERQLLQLLPPSMTEDDNCRWQLKQVVFYAASKEAGGSLALQMFERFLKGYAGFFHTHCDVDAGPELTKEALSKLHTLLLASGCEGVRKFLAAADEKEWEMSHQECDQLFAGLL